MAAVAVLDVARAAKLAREYAPDSDETELLEELASRKMSIQTEMNRFADLCDRWDGLYYPNDVTPGGADHWADHPTARLPGQSHVSVNAFATYVDVPASLQSVPPIENMVARATSPEAAQLASMVERLYTAFREEEELDLKLHFACVVKALYGRTAAKVWWDDDDKRPRVSIVDQPRNLYLGWGSTDYQRLDWAVYCYRMTESAVYETYGLSLSEYEDKNDNVRYSYVARPGDGKPTRTWLQSSELQVEVYDYWFKRPKEKYEAKLGKRVPHDTWNAIFVGNVMVHNERHPEYDGRMPYLPLFNTYLPGVPDGKPEFYDIEQLLREKDERISAGAAMIAKTVKGQFWQLVGPDAPATVPSGLEPKPDKVLAPGAGNRVEKIEPWMPEFQLEQYLDRIDRELSDVSGLNDLLRGLAPTAVLSSSKAISALTSNYEARIRIKRDQLYRWRRDTWALVTMIWGNKQTAMKPLFAEGVATLDIKAPSLNPRDDMEAAQIAQNLVGAKLWSMVRGMDHVGVDDPESEQNIIREEQTDATLNPAAVEVMAQLMSVLAAQGIQPSPGAQQMAQQQAGALQGGLNDMRQLGGGAAGVPSMNGPGEQPMPPPEQMPGNTPEGQQFTGPALPAGVPPQPAGPVPGGPAAAPAGQDLTAQQMIQGGVAKNRIISQQRVQRGGGG